MSKKAKNTATPKPAGAPKVRKPWALKQHERVVRTLKTLEKLHAHVTKVTPPGLDANLIANAHGAVRQFGETLATLGEWKPTKAGKPVVGSVIKVKSEALEAPTFKMIDASLFTGGTIKADDGTDWLVVCVDNVTRVLKKKFATLA